MDLAPRSLRRYMPRCAAISAALLAAGLLLRCGSDKGDKKNEPAPTPAPVPASWDGQADWSESAWKVTDE